MRVGKVRMQHVGLQRGTAACLRLPRLQQGQMTRPACAAAGAHPWSASVPRLQVSRSSRAAKGAPARAGARVRPASAPGACPAAQGRPAAVQGHPGALTMWGPRALTRCRGPCQRALRQAAALPPWPVLCRLHRLRRTTRAGLGSPTQTPSPWLALASGAQRAASAFMLMRPRPQQRAPSSVRGGLQHWAALPGQAHPLLILLLAPAPVALPPARASGPRPPASACTWIRGSWRRRRRGWAGVPPLAERSAAEALTLTPDPTRRATEAESGGAVGVCVRGHILASNSECRAAEATTGGVLDTRALSVPARTRLRPGSADTSPDGGGAPAVEPDVSTPAARQDGKAMGGGRALRAGLRSGLGSDPGSGQGIPAGGSRKRTPGSLSRSSSGSCFKAPRRFVSPVRNLGLTRVR